MNIREVIFKVLSEDATVASYVQDGSIFKISPIPMNQEYTAPYITYQGVSEPVSEVTESEVPRYQISCFAESANTAFEISEAVIKAMRGINGDYTGISVAYAQKENRIELFDDVTKLNYYVLDYRILHTRS